MKNYIKTTISIFDRILNWDFSDALQSQVKHAKTCCKNINSEDELEVFQYQFWSLVELCKFYINN